MYPTAMLKNKYPIGQSRWVEEISDIDQLGIYDVDIICLKDIVYPVLPRKIKTGLGYDLLDRRAKYT